MKRVTGKLGNMRKPQDFVVYPPSNKGNIIVQSDKAIGIFDIKTGKGVLNTKGCYFPHLESRLGAIPYIFPKEFVLQCIINYQEEGSLIGVHPETGGPVFMGKVTEI
jgi:hypothetical protein